MSTKERNLAADSLSVGESIVMGTAGAAPAFSLSITMAPFIATVGFLAPASILYCGLMMFGISLSFIHLNKVIVNAGTSYAWVSHVFGRHLGFLAGWALLVCSALFMVSGSIPAATSTLLLVSPHHLDSPGLVTGIAAIWLTLISFIAVKGIKPSAYVQVLMTSVEIVILVAVIIGGLLRIHSLPAHTFSIAWLSLSGFTPLTFATGALTAVFLYWGWDVTLNLNEETKNTRHAPGWGAFWSVVIIILLFVCFSIAALLLLTDAEIKDAQTNILFVMADKLFPRPWSYLAVISVILSSIGTLETSILQFTRTLFSVGRDKVLHHRYGQLHHEWNTPWVATLTIWLFGMGFLLFSSYSPTIELIIKDSINAIGFQIAFYYSLTGLACAWYYRDKWKGLIEFLGYILWPVVSSIFLIFIGGLSATTFDWLTNVIGLGGILIGLIPYYLNRWANR